MLLREVERSLRYELTSLGYDEFLSRMITICQKAVDLYRESTLGPYVELADETIRQLRQACEGGALPHGAWVLDGVAEEWSAAAREPVGGTGQVNLVFTFDSLCEELRGRVSKYQSASRVLMPFVEFPALQPEAHARGVRRISNREIDPNGELMALLNEVREIIMGGEVEGCFPRDIVAE